MNRLFRIILYTFTLTLFLYIFLVLAASPSGKISWFRGIPAPGIKDTTAAAVPEKKKDNGWFPAPDKKNIPVTGGTIETTGASLFIPSLALKKLTFISVTPVTETGLPHLAPHMTNVTPGKGGYRFLPHGLEFEKECRLTLAYDETLIPPGYSPDDIETFFFDEDSQQWIALKKVQTDELSAQISSLTTHFTDFINAVITVPSSPQNTQFTPTSFKEMEPADPSKEIALIDPPVASDFGNAVLGYPLKVPAGRQGMEPQLSINYNSEGGNGWMGLGWNLLLPAVTIETRWGVPRYNHNTETETYVLNGEQLSPVAHRGIITTRSAEKQFFPRVEKEFRKIIRHGSNPANYWWEVTDKKGMRFFYGGRPGTGTEPSSVLTDGVGNIAQWALVEERDPDENFIRYHYKKITDPGIPGGTVPGYQLYIDFISYTGHDQQEGPYRIQFFTNRDLNEPERKDVQISARLGFKEVTADLLRKVEVRMEGNVIRSYELNYQEGAFFKTLLKDIIDFDAEGTEFYRHHFSYYNPLQQTGSFQPFTSPVNWQSPDDDIHGDFINPIQHFDDDISAIGGNKSSGGGGGLTVTAGIFDGLLFSKSNTAGASFGYAKLKNEGMLQLVDINGDGLPDKVFKKNDRLFFRANESGPDGQLRFGPVRPVNGITDFDKGTASTTDGGIESNFGVYAGVQISSTRNEHTVYFADANGDMLIDIVKDGIVYFNRLDTAGNPLFSTSSSGTPSPVFSSGTIDPSLVAIDTAELHQLEKDNPLHDVVRVWKAPYSGIIRISNPVQLVRDTSDERNSYFSADGVRVAIQLKGAELWHAIIPANDYTPKFPQGLNLIYVDKGDQVYFRVQSIFNGAYDQVNWEPEITYMEDTPALVDPNGLRIYKFNAGAGFLATAPMSAGMGFKGVVQVKGNFEKPQTSDDIIVEVFKKVSGTDHMLWQQPFAWDSVVSEPINFTDSVDKGDEFYFRVRSNTNVNWKSINWSPQLYYISSEDTAVTSVFNSNGDPIFNSYPVVDFTIFNKTINPSRPWVAARNETIAIVPELKQAAGNQINDNIVFSIKKENQLVKKEVVSFQSGSLSGDDTLKIAVNTGDKLYLEFHTRNEELWQSLDKQNAWLYGQDTVKITPGASVFSEERHQFGAMYRQWGQFTYNGNGDRALQPINESELFIPASLSDPDSIDLSGNSNQEEMENQFDSLKGNTPADDKFIYMIPSAPDQAWKGYDDLTYVTSSVISSSRMGEDDLLPISPVTNGQGTGTGARAIKKISKTRNRSVSFGFVVNGSYSHGNTSLLYDYMDMNGDRYPDLLSKNRIQYTLPFGGLDAVSKSFDFGEVDHSIHYSDGLTKGGTFLTSGPFNTKSKNRGIKSSDAASDAAASASISGNFGENFDTTAFAWFDINGDGLPDRVYNDGQAEMNLGYSFTPKETWGFSAITEGNAISYGGGLGINIANNSISAGFGLSRTENNMNKALRDINGDGLPDFVMDQPELLLENTDPLQVAINTGNGFAPPGTWTGVTAISKDVSTGESANTAICACIPITPVTPVAKICFNPSGEISHGVSRDRQTLMDIDGDDFPDFIESEKDNDLKISRSAIGITNLLKTVSRPMGAAFTLSYKRTGNTYEMPSSMWTLAGVEMFDGLPGDGADTSFTSFEYTNGYYNRNEREFYGFGTVRTHERDTRNNNTVYRTTVKEFNNDNYYEKGLLLAETMFDSSGNKFRETLNQYQLRNIHTGSVLPAAYKNTDNGTAFPALTESRMLFYEGQPSASKSTRMAYNYDILGNLVSFTDFGDTDPSDDYTTQISYHAVPAHYIMGVPKSVQVTNNGTVFRRQEQDINPLNGKITEIRNYASPGTVSRDNMEYDGFGNLIIHTRPQNETGQRLEFRYEYDPEVHTYLTGMKDSYGYQSAFTYDLKFGQMLSMTDINHQKTNFTLDSKGRITSITGPMETAAGAPYTLSFDYHPHATVPWAMTRHFDPGHPSNPIEMVLFMDGLRRPVQLKKDGAIYQGPGIPDHEVMLVSGTDIYDPFGRVIESYYPVVEEKGTEGIFNPAADQVTPTRTAYDVMNRETRKVLPDDAVSTIHYGFGTDREGQLRFSKLTTDANGVNVEDFYSVRGIITASKNHISQQQDAWTSYKYNAIDELVETTDNEQHKITAVYDWLGRQTNLDHPDAGLTSYHYNSAGQLVKKVTANLQGSAEAIIYKYDFERLSGVLYPENPQNNVTYTYGQPDAPHNRAGRIAVQEDATGAQEFFYNETGNIIKNIRSVIIPLHGVKTYQTAWSYDTWNRMQSVTYPDGEVVSYEYNPGGQLAAVKGVTGNAPYEYIKQLGYDKFEQMIYLKYGNNTETFYSYEPERRRLHHLAVETALDRQMINTTYTYDREKNITGMHNDAAIPPANLMGGSSEYHFTYDGLYRLTNATGHFKGTNEEQKFELSMHYSTDGNIVKKEQLQERKPGNSAQWVTNKASTYTAAYEYNHGQPHAPVKIDQHEYAYDANGNLLGSEQKQGGQQRTIKWDEENRIKSIADNGAFYHYTYDADGERVLKNNGGNIEVKVNGVPAGLLSGIGNYTIYLNAYTEINSGHYTKHYFTEDRRFASRIGETRNLVSLPVKAGQPAPAGINFNRKEKEAERVMLQQFTESGTVIPSAGLLQKNPVPPGGATGSSGKSSPLGNSGNSTGSPSSPVYFYHPDHVGNTTYVTDADGEVFQHIEYLPFGETFIEEHHNPNQVHYLFNAKEQDEETGLYYFGARYYDTRTQVWQSADIDPQNYPGWSPYQYTFQNPVNYTDPDGRNPDDKVLKALNGLGYVQVARDYFEGFTQNVSYSFDNKPDRTFWSGGPLAMKSARKYAEKYGSITLEMTFEGQRLEKITNTLSRLSEEAGEKAYSGFLITENFWTRLSSGFARGATGKTAAVLNEPQMREGNIYTKDEHPQLQKNLKRFSKMVLTEIKIKTESDIDNY